MSKIETTPEVEAACKVLLEYFRGRDTGFRFYGGPDNNLVVQVTKGLGAPESSVVD